MKKLICDACGGDIPMFYHVEVTAPYPGEENKETPFVKRYDYCSILCFTAHDKRHRHPMFEETKWPDTASPTERV